VVATAVVVLAFATLAFGLSASAGLGGSLILVPVLALLLGPKEGVALAALLLASNNVAKVVAYRASIPWRAALGVVVLTMIGAAIGARLLVSTPEHWVRVAVVASIVLTLLAERTGLDRLRRVSSPVLAFCAGLTSGFSGTSGPLKGIALRNLRFDRQYLTGAASAVSLAGDAAKLGVFATTELIDRFAGAIWLAAIPLMVVATLAGRRINSEIGERGYAILFWLVMAGYTLRIATR
jgi:uncharacterized membrane protein YfcA